MFCSSMLNWFFCSRNCAWMFLLDDNCLSTITPKLASNNFLQYSFLDCITQSKVISFRSRKSNNRLIFTKPANRSISINKQISIYQFTIVQLSCPIGIRESSNIKILLYTKACCAVPFKYRKICFAVVR